MKTVVRTRDYGNTKVRFGGEFRRQIEDILEKYIKINIGIRK